MFRLLLFELINCRSFQRSGARVIKGNRAVLGMLLMNTTKEVIIKLVESLFILTTEI